MGRPPPGGPGTQRRRLRHRLGCRGPLKILSRSEQATVVFINRLQPADGKRDALIGLLREFADFEKHGEWMAPNIPRLVPLLASLPDPPVLLRSDIAGWRSEGVVLRVVGYCC